MKTKTARMNVSMAALALACASVVGLVALSGCAPQSTANAGPNDTIVGAPVPEAPQTNTTSMIEGAATAEQVEAYCLCCHLASDLPNWNKNTVDAAMVESMIPTLSDADIDALAAYFAAIEPQPQGEMH